MNKERLLEFCKRKEIWVPPGATVEQVHAAIVRATYNGLAPKTKKCFGWWEQENSACMMCDFEPHCFKASMRIEKEEYFKKFESAPRVRFTEKRILK